VRGRRSRGERWNQTGHSAPARKRAGRQDDKSRMRAQPFDSAQDKHAAPLRPTKGRRASRSVGTGSPCATMAAMSQDSIPKWILIVCGLICLLGLFVGGSLYVSPGTFIPNVDFSSKGVQFLANMWAARQIAIAGIIGFSLLRKSVSMLRISLGAYVVMNVQDALIGVCGKDPGLAIGATFFGVLAGFMCFRLGRNSHA